MNPIPFPDLKVGQKFRNIVDADHILRMRIESPPRRSENVVEIEGPHPGHIDYYSPWAMVIPVELSLNGAKEPGTLQEYTPDALVNYILNHQQTKATEEQHRLGTVKVWTLADVVVKRAENTEGLLWTSITVLWTARESFITECHGGIWDQQRFQVLSYARQILNLPTVETLKLRGT